MSRVITFSRNFPATHPRKGEKTYFVEQIWNSLGVKFPDGELVIDLENINTTALGIKLLYEFINSIETLDKKGLKHHTIRAGNRWKEGDWFSPRVWSGKPYASKQIIIAPDIQIKSVQAIRIEIDGDYLCILIDEYPFYEENESFVTQPKAFATLAQNDGLSVKDFEDWFQRHNKKQGNIFQGQILCWNENIKY